VRRCAKAAVERIGWSPSSILITPVCPTSILHSWIILGHSNVAPALGWALQRDFARLRLYDLAG